MVNPKCNGNLSFLHRFCNGCKTAGSSSSQESWPVASAALQTKFNEVCSNETWLFQRWSWFLIPWCIGLIWINWLLSTTNGQIHVEYYNAGHRPITPILNRIYLFIFRVPKESPKEAKEEAWDGSICWVLKSQPYLTQHFFIINSPKLVHVNILVQLVYIFYSCMRNHYLQCFSAIYYYFVSWGRLEKYCDGLSPLVRIHWRINFRSTSYMAIKLRVSFRQVIR